MTRPVFAAKEIDCGPDRCKLDGCPRTRARHNPAQAAVAGA
ncbi:MULTISPECIES: hypothetical protein [unclassified Pseudodesulfovibrio]|nr:MULTISPECIES: hypothetical protein [unclassified Pseudodesulfovibrio]